MASADRKIKMEVQMKFHYGRQKAILLLDYKETHHLTDDEWEEYEAYKASAQSKGKTKDMPDWLADTMGEWEHDVVTDMIKSKSFTPY